MDVYVDGKLSKHVNLRLSAGYHARRVVASIAWATSGKHTIKLAHREGGLQIPIDAFLVLQ